MQADKNEEENKEESQKEKNSEAIFVKSNGTNYIYQKSNSKENKTIICIHGISGHIELFADFASYFLNLEFEQYNVLRYDLIGRGHSDYPHDNKFDSESHLKQLRDLIVHLELDRSSKYIILGHSMGGCLATLYTNKYPEEVDALILLAPAGLLEKSFAFKLLDYCPSWPMKFLLKYIQETGWRLNFVDHWSPIANKIVSDLYDLHTKVPTIFDASYECLLQFPLSNLEEEVVTSLATNPTLPILLMWGKKDEIISCDLNFMKWAKLLEQKEKLLACTLYDELGHDFFIEDPENIFRDIELFLQHFL